MSLHQGLHQLQHQLQHVLPALRPRLPEWRPWLPQLQQLPWSRLLLAAGALLLLVLLVARLWSAKHKQVSCCPETGFGMQQMALQLRHVSPRNALTAASEQYFFHDLAAAAKAWMTSTEDW